MTIAELVGNIRTHRFFNFETHDRYALKALILYSNHHWFMGKLIGNKRW